ncbi:MAG: 3D domain-containing protein [Caulobacteraceae bacterium]
MLMPDGARHDGYWYASDIGGGVKGKHVDLFTGSGAASMQQFLERGLSASAVTAVRIGMFQGCPPRD